jgi:hypothetical protein
MLEQVKFVGYLALAIISLTLNAGLVSKADSVLNIIGLVGIVLTFLIYYHFYLKKFFN